MKDTVKSDYANHFLSLAYSVVSPLYDLVVWWGFIPLGGERECRREFVRWLYLEPGLRVASLCCGTGSMERAMLAEEPGLFITGVDLGRGQIARARKKLHDAEVKHLLRDAARTGLPSESYDRVLIGLALHEMPCLTRLAVLREAHRRCVRDGRALAIEHGRPIRRSSRLFRALWWFFWIPWNPEVVTSRDLRKRGLDNEMRECNLEVIERHTTKPDWIEGFLAVPNGIDAD